MFIVDDGKGRLARAGDRRRDLLPRRGRRTAGRHRVLRHRRRRRQHPPGGHAGRRHALPDRRGPERCPAGPVSRHGQGCHGGLQGRRPGERAGLCAQLCPEDRRAGADGRRDRVVRQQLPDRVLLFSAATLRNIENNLLYPVSATINEKVFDIDSQSEGAAGGSLPECEGGAGHHAAHLGAGLDRRAAGRIHAEAARPVHDQRRPARQHLRRCRRPTRPSCRAPMPPTWRASITRCTAIGPAGTVSLDRAHVDFTDASLWRAVNPMFSNDAALQLGARLAAGTELQFLFADRFGLFENSREVSSTTAGCWKARPADSWRSCRRTSPRPGPPACRWWTSAAAS